MADRDACDHFRGEPVEGDTPDQLDRRAFVLESIEIYCAGTDRRLAALQKRYAEDVAVTAVLGNTSQRLNLRAVAPDNSFKP